MSGVRMTSAARAQVRERYLAGVPRGYSPLLHLIVPSIVGLAAIDAAVSLLRGLSAWELALVPAFVVIANALEWNAHRWLLHQHVRPFAALYRRHALYHSVYVRGDMAVRDPRELKLVLLPPAATVAIAVLTLLVASALLLLRLRNLAMLWVATAAGYVMLYEWMHLAWHLPDDGLAERLPVLRGLRRLHELHHAPQRPSPENLNVTFPLFDLVCGTLRRPTRVGAPPPSSRRPSSF